jgi:hypothetical protein
VRRILSSAGAELGRSRVETYLTFSERVWIVTLPGETMSQPFVPPAREEQAMTSMDPASYAKKFSGKYEHRLIEGGIGHHLPQEAPQAFAQAVVDVDRL